MNPIIHHLEPLLENGPRPIGSPANQSAADYIRETFRAAGLEVDEQPYACTAWEHQSTLLEQDGRRLDAAANAFSLPCNVTAPVVCASTTPELESVSAVGCLLLLSGDLARAPLSPKSWFLLDERDNHIIQLLEQIQPAAILAPPTATDYFGQLTEDWELDLSAATVSVETALRLMNNSEKTAHLKIEATRKPATARNLIARTKGGFEKRVVVCAHFDTKINTPGASDNGASVAALLSLAEQFAHENLPFGLEFVAFNGEEYLPMGDDEYLRRSENYFGSILACINMDGGGTALGSTSITCMSAPEGLEAGIRSIAADFPGVVWVDPWPESNHSTFAFRGIPSVALSAVGTRKLAHSAEDGLEVISDEKLVETAKVVTGVIRLLRNG